MPNIIAVAMSVYKSDNVEQTYKSIESILTQTVYDFDLYISVDGYVDFDLRYLLIHYSKQPNVYVYFHSKNKGLATRLNEIIDIVSTSYSYQYLARMDSDDISISNRFSKQLDFLVKNPEVSVVGSDVIEISNSGHQLFYKKMDAQHETITRNIIKKCPFNHPSVMFRMSIFEEGFRYKSELKNTQDYYLWVDLVAAGKTFANINEPLLKFRVDDDFHSRRGFDKAMNDLNSRIYAFKHLDVLTLSNVVHTIKLFLLRLAPSFIKKWAYNNLR